MGYERPITPSVQPDVGHTLRKEDLAIESPRAMLEDTETRYKHIGPIAELVHKTTSAQAAYFQNQADQASSFEALQRQCDMLRTPDRLLKFNRGTGSGRVVADFYDAHTLIPQALDANVALDHIKRDFAQKARSARSEDEYEALRAQQSADADPFILASTTWQRHAVQALLTAHQLNTQAGMSEPPPTKGITNLLYSGLDHLLPEDSEAGWQDYAQGMLSGVMGPVWLGNALAEDDEDDPNPDRLILTVAPPKIDAYYATDLFAIKGRNMYLIQVKTNIDSRLPKSFGPQFEVRDPEEAFDIRDNHPDLTMMRRVSRKMNALQEQLLERDPAYSRLDIRQRLVYITYPRAALPQTPNEWVDGKVQFQASIDAGALENPERLQQ